MVRMIELDPSETITGIYVAGEVIGQANVPMATVPHPDMYAQFEGISARTMAAEEFEALWAEACAMLGRG